MMARVVAVLYVVLDAKTSKVLGHLTRQGGPAGQTWLAAATPWRVLGTEYRTRAEAKHAIVRATAGRRLANDSRRARSQANIGEP